MRAKNQFFLSLPQLYREFNSRLYNLLKFLRRQALSVPYKNALKVIAT